MGGRLSGAGYPGRAIWFSIGATLHNLRYHIHIVLTYSLSLERQLGMYVAMPRIFCDTEESMDKMFCIKSIGTEHGRRFIFGSRHDKLLPATKRFKK